MGIQLLARTISAEQAALAVLQKLKNYYLLSPA